MKTLDVVGLSEKAAKDLLAMNGIPCIVSCRNHYEYTVPVRKGCHYLTVTNDVVTYVWVEGVDPPY